MEPAARSDLHDLYDRDHLLRDRQRAQVAEVNAGQLLSYGKMPFVATGVAAGVSANWMLRILDPKVDGEIMIEIGERKVLEIHKHWMASSWALIRLAFGTSILILLTALTPTVWYEWIGYFALVWWMILISVRAVHRVLEHYRDRFVITSQRIVRVDGVIGQDASMIPLKRITDITVKQSFLGKIFNYGHMIFESAGQVQGLDEIRWVANPKKRKRVLLIAMNGENPDALVLDPAEGNPIEDGT
jgi:uncharacterized membrane protein YdbT with pleckstrin-like domain